MPVRLPAGAPTGAAVLQAALRLGGRRDEKGTPCPLCPCPGDLPIRYGRSWEAAVKLRSPSPRSAPTATRSARGGGCSPRAGAHQLPPPPSARPLGPGSAAAIFLALPPRLPAAGLSCTGTNNFPKEEGGLGAAAVRPELCPVLGVGSGELQPPCTSPAFPPSPPRW